MRAIKLSVYTKIFLSAILLLIIFCIFSCNVKKHISKSTTEEKTITDTKTAITTTITEKIDTTIVIKADTLKSTETVQEFESGNPIEVDNLDLKLLVKIDPKTKRVTATAIKKPETVHAYVSKKTETVEIQDKKEDKKIKQVLKDKNVERTGGLNFNYLWWLLLLLAIPIFKYRKFLLG